VGAIAGANQNGGVALFGVADDFLTAADATVSLFESGELAARWDEPSALAEFSVRGLAGHLVRAVTLTRYVFEEPEPAGEPADAAGSYADAVKTWPDRAGEIRQRGEDAAAAGADALAASYAEGLKGLRDVLSNVSATRRVTSKGRVLSAEDYLTGRAVELIVHADDLAVSIGVDTPALPERLTDAVIAHLVNAARARHGDLAVLRALTRRERDTVEALRVV
jgi:uncharacterized protein (TIGR03083 family)